MGDTFARVDRRIANKSIFTLTSVAARKIVADSMRSTRIVEAFVDVHTGCPKGVETLATNTFLIDALSIQGTIVVAGTQCSDGHLKKSHCIQHY